MDHKENRPKISTLSEEPLGIHYFAPRRQKMLGPNGAEVRFPVREDEKSRVPDRVPKRPVRYNSESLPMVITLSVITGFFVTLIGWSFWLARPIDPPPPARLIPANPQINQTITDGKHTWVYWGQWIGWLDP